VTWISWITSPLQERPGQDLVLPSLLLFRPTSFRCCAAGSKFDSGRLARFGERFIAFLPPCGFFPHPARLAPCPLRFYIRVLLFRSVVKISNQDSSTIGDHSKIVETGGLRLPPFFPFRYSPSSHSQGPLPFLSPPFHLCMREVCLSALVFRRLFSISGIPFLFPPLRVCSVFV